MTLVSADRGVRWICRAKVEGDLGEPIASEFLATRAGTELIWIGEGEKEALDKAEIWMRERYEVIETRPVDQGPGAAAKPAGKKRSKRNKA